MPQTSPDISPLLAHVVPYTLVMFRIAGVFIMAPLLTSVVVPARYKALLILMLSAAVYPLVNQGLAIPAGVDLLGLVPLIVGESLIGFAIGGIAAIPLLSLEIGGVLMGQSMGFGLARVYNPEADFDTDILGQLLFYVGAGIFVAFGGLELLVGGVIRSFSHVPIGGFRAAMTPLDLLVNVMSSGFELAIRVAAPVTAIVLLLVIVFGVVGKTMPQINIMSVGFAIKILAGLTMLAMAIYAMRDAIGDEASGGVDRVLAWVSSLSAE